MDDRMTGHAVMTDHLEPLCDANRGTIHWLISSMVSLMLPTYLRPNAPICLITNRTPHAFPTAASRSPQHRKTIDGV